MPLLSIALTALLAGQAGAADAQSDAAQEIVEPAPTREQAAYTEALVRTLQRSASPRERAMSTQVYENGVDQVSTSTQRGRLLRNAARAAPADVFVPSMWANASPEESGCDSRSPCPERRLALARLEPGNAIAWMPAFSDLDPIKDEAGIQEILGKMANSNRADDHFVDLIEEWLRIFRSTPVPSSDQGRDPSMDAAFAQAVSSLPLYYAFYKACKRSDLPVAPASRFELCAAAGRKLRDDSETLISRVFGAAIVKASGAATAEDREVRRRLRWVQHSSVEMNKVEESAAESRLYFSDLLATRSELKAIELKMARSGVERTPPADWNDEYERHDE
jgi:hypothetical protein